MQFRVFLYTGTTLAILRTDGNIPDEKEKLKRSTKGLDISFFRRIKMLFGTLYGPTDLFLSRDDMMLALSSLLAGWIKNDFFTFITQIIRTVFMRVFDVFL